MPRIELSAALLLSAKCAAPLCPVDSTTFRCLRRVHSGEGELEPQAATYTYDDRGQLTGADRSGSSSDESYAYDTNGNRDTANGASYTIGANNQIASDGTFDYLYDAEGNRTRKTEISSGDYVEYEWDYHNRLAAVGFYDDSDVLQKRVEYEYDLFDRRVVKRVDADGDTDFDAGQFFAYDGAHIALVFDDAGSLTNRYLHGPVIDQILADEQVHWDAIGEDYVTDAMLWALADHLGTVRDVAEYNPGTETTTVVNHLVIDSYGRITSETNSSVLFVFAFTGRERDDDALLTYFRRRWYDADIGQFVSQDPIGFTAQDPNLQRYVSNQPNSVSDPSGLQAPVVAPTFGPSPSFVPIITPAVPAAPPAVPVAPSLPATPPPAVAPAANPSTVSPSSLLRPVAGTHATTTVPSASQVFGTGAAIMRQNVQNAAMLCFRLEARNREIETTISGAVTNGRITAAEGLQLYERLGNMPGTPNYSGTGFEWFWNAVTDHNCGPYIGLHANQGRTAAEEAIQELIASRPAPQAPVPNAPIPTSPTPATATNTDPSAALSNSPPTRPPPPDLPRFRNEDERPQTSGVLITFEGDVVQLTSGGANPTYANYPAASHVEGKAAIYIREHNSRGGWLFHNNPNGVCHMCHTNLPYLLPEGAILYVISPAGCVPRDGTWHLPSSPYVGNANPLKPNSRLP